MPGKFTIAELLRSAKKIDSKISSDRPERIVKKRKRKAAPSSNQIKAESK